MSTVSDPVIVRPGGLQLDRKTGSEEVAPALQPAVAVRFHQLDSMRGIAAFSVVLFHFREIWKPADPSILLPWQRLALTVLKPFYSGVEAVILFFLLSGFVLSLPYLTGKGQPYPRYVARRIVRIYGPYLAALALALIAAIVWGDHPWHGPLTSSTWTKPLTFKLIAQHVLFLGSYDWRQYDFVIWSLIHELRISIVFPFLYVIAVRIGGARAVLLAAALSAVAFILLPPVDDASARFSFGTTIHYAAFFLIGITLARNNARARLLWESLSKPLRVLTVMAGAACFTYGPAIAARILAACEHRQVYGTKEFLIVSTWTVALGAAALMMIGLNSMCADMVLKSASARFLGKISYSLYLIHPIVLLGLTFSFHDRVSMWLQFPVYVALAVLVAWLFWCMVERPMIILSRSI